MLTIQPLSGNHDRRKFDCGRSELNEWLLRYARQHQERGISQTFIGIELDAPAKILGYYALTACEVVTAELPAEMGDKLPRKAPGILLGRLAVDSSVQGQGLGELLLADAIARTCNVKQHIGVYALFVDAIDDKAAAFYKRYGFHGLPDSPKRLVLPLAGVCTAK
jgi:GNAT superfamily N-acetyltransferase